MADWNRETPWRQGNLLCANAVASLDLANPGLAEQTLVIVATHDCDLAQSADAEPFIELIVGRLAQKDGNCTHGKSVRKLHIEFSGAPPAWAEFKAEEKIVIEKSKLSPFNPREDLRLNPESAAIFQMWLASRYRRSAFADEFEKRLKDAKLDDKISKAVKPLGELVLGVFFDVDDGEETVRNGQDDTYDLGITILHAAEPDFFAAEQAALSAAASIKAAFKKKLFEPNRAWRSIELRYCEAVSEAALTYQDFKQMKRWRLDHLSLGADPQAPVVAE